MKNVLIGIVAVLVIAFAAHAADKQKSAAQVAQSASVAQTTDKPATVTTRAQKPAAVTTPAQKPATVTTPAQKPATVTTRAQKPATVTTRAQKPAQQAPALTKVNNNIATQKMTLDENQIDSPDSIAEYDFAFVAPEAVALDSVSGATELALQNVTDLSPSAPRQ